MSRAHRAAARRDVPILARPADVLSIIVCVTGQRGAGATELVAVLAGLVAITLAATFPLVLHPATLLPNDIGDPLLNAWILWWDATAIRHGLDGLWDAPTYFPYSHTLAYSDHLFGIAVFTAPLLWLTANPVLVYNLAFIASYANAGIGMYLLARVVTGRRDAAAVAAAIYAFSAFRVAHFAHLQWLMTGWLPLSLWALHRYFATGAWRYLLASGFFYLMQCLTANYFAYFGLLPLAAVGIAEMWRRRPPPVRTAVHVIAVAVLAALVLAPIARVYYRVRQENNFRRTSDEIERLSADVGDYFRGHNRIWLWRHARPGTGEHELFPGAVALVLAGVALSTRRGRTTPHAGLYAAIAAIAFVLSLGPHPTAWGHRAAIPGPYQLLLDLVPGLDGLRAVSRMGLLVNLALAVLAAQGAVVLLDRVGSRRTWVVALLGALIVTESWAVPVRTALFDPIPDPDDRQAYEFLRQSAAGPVLELPFATDDEARQMTYQYLTLVHGHRTINGRSSYDPPLLRLLSGRDQGFGDASHLGAAVGCVRALGTRYVVVHGGRFGSPAMEAALIRALENGQIAARHDFGRTVVFTLAEDVRPVEGVSHPIPPTAMRTRSSHSPDRLPLLFDGDRDSRWLSAGRQTGREWIEIELDGPRDVGHVRMQAAERSFGDYPRELTIEAVEPAGTRTLFSGSVLPHFARGFLVDHAYPIIDVALPPNRARVIRLRQGGATDELFWSIHELELLERGDSDTRSTGDTR
jgi:hypothetical protein